MDTVLSVANELFGKCAALAAAVLGIRIAGTYILYLVRSAMVRNPPKR